MSARQTCYRKGCNKTAKRCVGARGVWACEEHAKTFDRIYGKEKQPPTTS